MLVVPRTVDFLVSSCFLWHGMGAYIIRCDHLFFGVHYSTYYNDSLNCYSTIDYLFTRNCETVANYNVIDPVLNLSDHRPVVIRCNCVVAEDRCCSKSNALFKVKCQFRHKYI